jgi:hypothetical protein
MALTLAEAAKYTSEVMKGSFLAELTRESPWLAEYRAQMEREWRAKPWYGRAWIRTRNWVRAHTPHVHLYLGEHPRDDDW